MKKKNEWTARRDEYTKSFYTIFRTRIWSHKCLSDNIIIKTRVDIGPEDSDVIRKTRYYYSSLDFPPRVLAILLYDIHAITEVIFINKKKNFSKIIISKIFYTSKYRFTHIRTLNIEWYWMVELLTTLCQNPKKI